MNSLRDLKNLGPASEKMLHQAGIFNESQLIELGAVETFIRVKLSGQKPSLNLLYALHGAINNTHWNKLSNDSRNQLLVELDAHLDGLKTVTKPS